MIPLDDRWEMEMDSFLRDVDGGEIPYAEQLPVARRFMWEQVNEQRLPEGFWLRHDCDTRECVNPSHAVLVKIGE